MRLGDRLLLCTDGLSNMLTDHEIAVLVAAGSPADSAQSLISAANEAGGLDNISVVVVEVIG
jgi:PPM family protein phosphatase